MQTDVKICVDYIFDAISQFFAYSQCNRMAYYLDFLHYFKSFQDSKRVH